MLLPQNQQTQINPALQAIFEALVRDRQARFDRIQEYRAYAAGEKYAHLNDDQVVLIGTNPKFSINVCPAILTAKVDRLKILSVFVEMESEDEARATPIEQPTPEEELTSSDVISTTLSQWMDKAKLDALMSDLFFITARDGDGYLIVSHDGTRPTFTLEPAFDGKQGTMMVYQDRQAMYAFRRWQLFDVNKPLDDPLERLNVYYENRIERFYSVTTGGYVNAGWLPYKADDLPSILYTTVDGTPDGQGLGLPVFHFVNNGRDDDYGESDLMPVIPSLQDSLNLAGVSVLAAAQLAGFPVNYMIGVDMPTSGSYETYPGALLVNRGSANSISIGQFPAANLAQLIEVETNIKRTIATVTGTPLLMLNPTGAIAAEGTLQQMEAPLIAKVENAQQDYGEVYEAMLRQALKLDIVHNPTPQLAGLTLEGVEALDFTITWKAAQLRNELDQANTLRLHKEMGVPEEIIWAKLGYSAEEIERMKEVKDALRAKGLEETMVQNETIRTEALMRAGQMAMSQQQRRDGMAIPSGNGQMMMGEESNE